MGINSGEEVYLFSSSTNGFQYNCGAHQFRDNNISSANSPFGITQQRCYRFNYLKQSCYSTFQ
jgi:hypothetical protein